MQVARTALVGALRQGTVRAVLCVEPEPGTCHGARHGAWPRIEGELRALGKKHPHTRRIQDFLRYPRAFPVDVRHNAKIEREALAVWAGKRLSRP